VTRARADRAPGVPRELGARTGGVFRASPTEQERLRSALDTHFALVWRSLRRFGVPEDRVDDAAQHVFLTLAERLPGVAPSSERSFLIGVCLRIAANTRRGVARNVEVPSAAIEQHGAGANPEELLASKQRRRVLDRALDALSLEQRTVFVLFELEGFSLPEIAQSLGLPLGTATSRLRRARLRFEAWVEALHESGEVP